MNNYDRAQRDREIEALFLAGNRPSYIASLYNLNAVRVRRILHERGFELEGDTHSVWDLPEAKRREAIWERQREGAREALAH